jgi:tRNA1Val (adenine37-N6)-methyltransferase
METTRGTLLGGRVRHDQPASGHRTGIEPVLLAAAVPACAGERVLEGGTGVGTALLCLAARMPGIAGVGIERDAALVGVARANAAENRFDALSFVAGDLCEAIAAAPFDHAMANPPWHPAGGTASSDAGRETAKRGEAGLIDAWTRALAAPLRDRATLTIVIAAARLADCLAALTAARCGSPSVFPLWRKEGKPAKLVLVRGVKGGRGPCRLLQGLVLHRSDGRYTEAAEAVLRDAAALEF